MVVPIVHTVLHHMRSLTIDPESILRHYSVIVSAAGSLFALVSAVTLMAMKCCCSTADNRAYTLEWSAEGKVESRTEQIILPVKRMSVSKITLPPVSTTCTDDLEHGIETFLYA